MKLKPFSKEQPTIEKKDHNAHFLLLFLLHVIAQHGNLEYTQLPDGEFEN